MLIKRISLKNFRQYDGENKIPFSVDPEKNITFFLGGTGFGKTTLCQAFRWCLYGKSDFKKPEDILSQRRIDELRDGQSCSTEVALEISHGGVDYIIRRGTVYQKKNNRFGLLSTQFHVYFNDAGIQKEVSNKVEFVNEIIPEELSEYFFLSGEKIEAMSDDIKKGKSKAFGEAVNTLLDLDYYKNAIKHLKSISKEYNTTSVSGVSNFEKELDGLNAKISANRKNKETFDDLITQEENSCEYHLEKIAECKFKLKNIVSAKDIAEDRESKLVELQKLKKNIEQEHKLGIQKFINSAPYFFARTSMDAMLSYLKDASNIESDEIPDKLHADLIDWIEKNRKCICGTCLSHNEVESLEKWRHIVPPESLGSLINSVKRETEMKKRLGEGLDLELQSRKDRVIDYYDDIEEIENEILVLDEKLAKAEDTSEIERELQMSKRDLDSAREQVVNYRKKLFEINMEFERLCHERERLLESSDEGRKVLAWKNVTDRLIADFEAELKKDEQKKRQNLIDAVQESFKKIYDADFTIDIDDEYNITTTSKKELSTGQGLSVIFAFLSGLLDVIKENKDAKDGMPLESYPLVLDAPFSVLDQDRIESLCDVLPKVSEQIIIFIKDVDGEIARERMSSKIGKSYKLVPMDKSFQCTTVEED